ncbi:hypothetical protein [Chitiniphilus eburneus]|uniref:Uncharacterized protein n=1 Tax=Chitiniphilus eburneus TaxID=2571148 RepID=A0A4U0PXJ5_9NEIS|nr:hypothetical protein [Chitiniphilus eburneus]TJZ73306.1 hypothetical protein FAZ21_10610 [Chitiniphilus eburneus]
MNSTLIVVLLTPALSALLNKALCRFFPARDTATGAFFWDDRALRRNKAIDQIAEITLIACLLAGTVLIVVSDIQSGGLFWLGYLVPLGGALLIADVMTRLLARLVNGRRGHAQYRAYGDVQSGYSIRVFVPLKWLLLGLAAVGFHQNRELFLIGAQHIFDYFTVLLERIRSL